MGQYWVNHVNAVNWIYVVGSVPFYVQGQLQLKFFGKNMQNRAET